MPDAVLALNAGSSSIKFGLFEAGASGKAGAVIARGVLEDAGDHPRFTAKDGDGKTLAENAFAQGADHATLLGGLLAWIEAHLGSETLVAVGHRVVHGGRDFAGPVRLDPRTIAAIEALTPLAPLHQPRSLEPICALSKLRPDLPQTASFDTAFHHALAPPVSRYAIPRALEAEGVRKYGFHGLSYRFIAGALAAISPDAAAKRTVVAHLGNGASLCAMRDGASHDTTMGFSALDGLVMGTRCGALDPGVLLYLGAAHGMTSAQIEDLLYHQCGLKGVSGISADVRELTASPEPHAAEALDLFTFRIARETAAMANTLEGLDAFVFTGGIGEHATDIRAAVCRRLAWLGVVLDPAANALAAPRISAPASRVTVRVIATDEEIVIAREALGILAGA